MPSLKVNKLIIILMGLCWMASFSYADGNLKTARLAGSWYPGQPSELAQMINGFLAAAEAPAASRQIGVLISPHAGYVFSAPVAAYGFKAAMNQKVSTVIILAPSHHFSFTGASVWAEGAFETPLGRVTIDQELAARILAYDSRFTFRKDVFEGVSGRPENSVETQIPFIQQVFPSARIVPVILGYPPDGGSIRVLVEALVAAVGDREDVLVNVSVDQSHFHTDAEARQIDERGLRAVSAMDVEALWQGHEKGLMEVDGFHVVTAAILYAKQRGFNKARVLKYATSADVTGDQSRVVGYASAVVYKEEPSEVGALNIAQKARLITVARDTVEKFVRTGKVLEVQEADPRLQVPEGAFVTLHKGRALRGCIGNIWGQGPLVQTVRDMTVAAASEDPRFPAVTAAELSGIRIEVSVLSTPQLVRSVDEIELGKHGVIVSRGQHNRGVFLPQVATETGWSKERFLSELCSQKAGLPADCWKQSGIRLETFTADVFGEE